MRASPAFEISLYRFGVWRGGVVVLAALGLSALAGWVITREGPMDAALTAVAAVCAVALLWLAATLARVPARGLRWDGFLWHVGPPGSIRGDSAPGDLAVVVDLGPWMLLRFRPAASHRHLGVIWLPVQRRGIETQWHGLRCSVYSPRPAPASDTPKVP